MRARFTIKTVFLCTTLLCGYLALTASYGFGRAIICAATILLGMSSILFLLAGYESAKEDHRRHAIASFLLAVLILAGTSLMATFVFQPVVSESPSAFDVNETQTPSSSLPNR